MRRAAKDQKFFLSYANAGIDGAQGKIHEVGGSPQKGSICVPGRHDYGSRDNSANKKIF